MISRYIDDSDFNQRWRVVMVMSYELIHIKNGKFMFHLKSANQEVILSSEVYNKKASALDGIKSVQRNGTQLKRFNLCESSDQKSYFVLKAVNGKIIGCSEMYESKAAAEKGIQSVLINAESSEIREYMMTT